MSIPSTQIPNTSANQWPESRVMTVVFFIIGLSVILSYEWGAAPPGFRPDAPWIILFAVLVASLIFIASWASHQGFGHQRLCTSCGQRIQFDALFCPYCGYQFPR